MSVNIYNSSTGELVNIAGSDTIDKIVYGTCSTAKTTAAKTVTVSAFELAQGAKIIVKFTNGNTASNPTLNINNTGAKAIYVNGAALETELEENGSYLFVYNGTQYDLVGGVGSDGGSASAIRIVYEESPALKAHAVNDYIYFNDHVYKVISAISIGDTITIGTNVDIDSTLSENDIAGIEDLPGGGSGGGGEDVGLSVVDGKVCITYTIS